MNAHFIVYHLQSSFNCKNCVFNFANFRCYTMLLLQNKGDLFKYKDINNKVPPTFSQTQNHLRCGNDCSIQKERK